MKKQLLLSFLAFAIGSQVQPAMAAPGDPAPFLPPKPADLIVCMPAAPVGWTMQSSFASNTFNSGWVTAYADRAFKKDPPPPVPGAPVPPVPPPPITMTVHLSDTGYKEDFAGIVTPPKNQSGAPSKATYLQIKDYPARMVSIDDKTTVIDFVMKDRFLIEVRAINLPDDKVKEMVEAFDFSKLLTVPDKGETRISDPVVLSRVDEMHPENTHSYPLFWSVAKETKPDTK